jgi:hypothetical protein
MTIPLPWLVPRPVQLGARYKAFGDSQRMGYMTRTSVIGYNPFICPKQPLKVVCRPLRSRWRVLRLDWNKSPRVRRGWTQSQGRCKTNRNFKRS